MKQINLIFYSCLLLFTSLTAQAAITFEGTSTQAGWWLNGSVTSPIGIQIGDVLITQITLGYSVFGNSIDPPGNNEWTAIESQQQDGSVLQSVYYKVATAADVANPNPVNFSWDWFLARYYIINLQVYRGVDSPAVDVSATNTGMSGADVQANSVNTSSADEMLIAFYSLEAGNQSFTAHNGMTEIYDVEVGDTSLGLTVMSAYQLLSSSDNTGAKNGRATRSNDAAVSHTVALNALAEPPEVLSLTTNCSNLTELQINFSQDLNSTTAQTIGNYNLTNAALSPVVIVSAVLSAANQVTLTTGSSLFDLTAYTLTVNNVENLTGDIIDPNSAQDFMLSCGLNCITDNFTGPGALSSSWSVGNSSGSFGDPIIVENGRLRLTDASGNVSTVATLLNQFPGEDNRIEIEFDYYGYDGSGADGIAVNFSDASITPAAGAFGGSLGYAQRTSENGFAGGWIGVGIDEYGNYSNSNEGRSGGIGFSEDSVAIRGSGSGNSGYPYLTGTTTLAPEVDDSSSSSASPGHRYKIVIDHTAGGAIALVSVSRDSGSGYITIIPEFNVFTANPSQAVVPANWVVSFTGSTGGSTNIHEIGDFKVCAAQPIQTFSMVDHYDISHTTPGLTCEGSQVTITAHDASHTEVTVLSDTSISVTTNPVVTNIVSSPVTLLTGTSSTSFYLQQTSVLSDIDIDVNDGNKTDDDGSLEDPRISFLDAAFRFYANGNNTDSTPIGTQISGKNSALVPGNQDLTLHAVRTNTDTGACEAGLEGIQTVDIAYRCINPVNCSATQLSLVANTSPSISGTNNADSLTYTAADMIFDAAGSAPFSFSLADAGQISLHASLAVAATVTPPNPDFVLTGASNEFVVRPFAFELLLFDEDSISINSTADNELGTRFVSAGSDFFMQIRAVNWQAADDNNDDGIVDIDGATGEADDLSDNSVTLNFGQENSAVGFTPTHDLDQPSGGQDDAFSSSGITAGGASTQFTNGLSIATATTLNWSEVGIIDITLMLDNYLSASDADILGLANNIGRFYPAQFVMSSASATNSCGSFSYMGQTIPDTELNITYTLQALSIGGSLTENYTGGFAKATPASHINLVAENNNDGSSYVSRLENLVDGMWINGEYSYSDNGYFSRGISVDGPYSLLQLGIEFSDNDGNLAGLPNLNMKADTSTDCGALGNCDAWFIGDLDVRFGHLKLSNVFGPETFALDMGVRTEYFDGTRFIVNTDDNCTNIVATDPPFSPVDLSWTDNLAAGDSTISLGSDITDGLGTIQFGAAGLGNDGSVVFEYTIGNWLKTENTGNGDYLDNPFGKVTFGQFRGTDRMIYWREVVR
jgi:MSHA biogenesis protein MshQ